MSDNFLGEIRIFAGNFAPRGWALCSGQLMSISQNTALFSLLGTSYGGDGKVTFALPQLNDSVPIGVGQGPGLSFRTLGEQGGSPYVSLLSSEMPAHSHTPMAYSDNGTTETPTNNVWGEYSVVPLHGPAIHTNLYNPNATPGTLMSPMALGVSGGSQPHNNMQPFLALSYIIATEGIFPQRP